jgi:CRISPR-associated protein Csd2
MTAIDRRYDFVLYFDVRDGNPNGDPDAFGMPRVDPETGQGLVTDVCLKRKIRNYVETARPDEDGYQIYVRDGAVLNREHELAYAAKGLKPEKQKFGGPEITSWMCDRYFDIRTFGAVMSTEVNAGQVRGPVQLTFARSEDPVFARDVAITRLAVTNERDVHKGRTIGRKYTVAYGLYRAHGFVSAPLASKTGFSVADLELLWEALEAMFEHDRSASHGTMATRALIIFDHGCKLGRAHAHELFSRVRAELRDPAKPPRDFGDYQLSLDGEAVHILKTIVPVTSGMT